MFPQPFRPTSNSASFTGFISYSFNGQEKDDEITNVTGSLTTAMFWEYDSRLGRRWNIDPVVKVWQSPYACFRNNSLLYVDPNGDDDFFDSNGKYLGCTTEGNIIRVVNSGYTYDQATKDIPNTTKMLTEISYCPTDLANRSMLMAVSTYYAKDAGISKSIKIKDYAKAIDNTGPAFGYDAYGTKEFEIIVSKTYNINLNMNDKYNVINSLVHEKKHEDDPSTWTAFGETDAILTQVKDVSFSKTTSAFKWAVADYATQNLNKALLSGTPATDVQKKVDELNASDLGNYSTLLYDSKSNTVSYVATLKRFDVKRKKDADTIKTK